MRIDRYCLRWLSLARNYYKIWGIPPLTTNFIDTPNNHPKLYFQTNDNFGFFAKQNISEESIFKLAGGFPTTNFIGANFFIESISDEIITTLLHIHFGNDLFGLPMVGQVSRRIDLANKVVHNEIMHIPIKNKGYGTNIFLTQLKESFDQNFNLLVVSAAGPDLEIPTNAPIGFRWDGYKIWAKYGYLMNPYSQTKFEVWAKRNIIKEKQLNYLYTTNKAVKKWEDSGFTWEGYFKIKKKSKSMLFLKIYLLMKKIKLS